MKIIAGLGNPGAEYENTRHNAGFKVQDFLAEKYNIKFKRSWRVPGKIGNMVIHGESVILLKPATYVNRSGEAIAALMRWRQVALSELIVVIDDADLQCGKIRARARGGAGGHNGLKSIISALGSEDFIRVRIGIGPRPPSEELVEFVLSGFSEEEAGLIASGMEKAVAAIECIIDQGIEKAMNRYNLERRCCMVSLNRVLLAGYLTRDPEVRYTPSGIAVANLNMAINPVYMSAGEEKKGKTCFVTVVVWRRQAETSGEYLSKGSPLLVEGILEYDQWETESGEKKSRLRVRADRVQFLSSGRRGDAGPVSGVERGAPPSGEPPDMERPPPEPEQADEDDLPF